MIKNIHLQDTVFEFSAINKEIPAAYVSGEGGLFYLCSLEDTWVLPFIKRKLRLNLDKVYLPKGSVYCITDSMLRMQSRDIVRATDILGCKVFPTSIEVKAKGLLPVKVPAGSPVTSLILFYQMEPHLYDIDRPSKSI